MKAECPICKKPLSFHESAFGKRGRCQSCGAALIINNDGRVSADLENSMTQRGKTASLDKQSRERSSTARTIRRWSYALAAGIVCLVAGFVVGLVVMNGTSEELQETRRMVDEAKRIATAANERIKSLEGKIALLPKRPEMPKTICAERFELVGKTGKTLVVIGATSKGDPAVSLYGIDGDKRASLAIRPDGTPVLSLLHKSTASFAKRGVDRKSGVEIGVSSDGSPWLTMYGSMGMKCASLTVSNGGDRSELTLGAGRVSISTSDEKASFQLGGLFGTSIFLDAGLAADNAGLTMTYLPPPSDRPVERMQLLLAGKVDMSKIQTRAHLGLRNDGSPSLWLADKKSKRRFNLAVFPSGTPFLVLNDANENSVTHLTTGPDGSLILLRGRKAFMAIIDKDKKILHTWPSGR